MLLRRHPKYLDLRKGRIPEVNKSLMRELEHYITINYCTHFRVLLKFYKIQIIAVEICNHLALKTNYC